MTRNEAIQRSKLEHNDAVLFVDAIEALGLIKFDTPLMKMADTIIKEAREYLDISYRHSNFNSKYVTILNNLLDIINNKYSDIKTVRIGVNTTVVMDYASPVGGAGDCGSFNGKLLAVEQTK